MNVLSPRFRIKQHIATVNASRHLVRHLLVAAFLGLFLVPEARGQDLVDTELTADFLRSTVTDLDQRMGSKRAIRAPEASQMTDGVKAQADNEAMQPPKGASSHQPSASGTTVRSRVERLKRTAPKATDTMFRVAPRPR